MASGSLCSSHARSPSERPGTANACRTKVPKDSLSSCCAKTSPLAPEANEMTDCAAEWAWQMAPAALTWLSWQLVSMTYRSCRPNAATAAKSLSMCSKTGSMSTASLVDAQPNK
eukprot:CAMPEP_0177287058 /NCGR_PEP_ID=MMETSP0367-20130122/73952_1 /TAXON_ID=447022 ORGANISM="Scrippsiella hangoei-like, Strain SHHI-4" /NCGR_SAMPLE_ID=MMETSP0367 /ASSEMBLY_ACC=CAM_ASM_000362 /LENGTH=113 /DNA_ID=CAMNT_0018744343 /DNA_START=291 /DNA_END=632 /DNA_ORIENTATION=-